MIDRELLEIRRQHAKQLRALGEVLRQLAARDVWLRDREQELHLRLKAIDGQTPQLPPWPTITVPPELAGLLEGD